MIEPYLKLTDISFSLQLLKEAIFPFWAHEATVCTSVTMQKVNFSNRFCPAHASDFDLKDNTIRVFHSFLAILMESFDVSLLQTDV